MTLLVQDDVVAGEELSNELSFQATLAAYW